MSESIKAGDFRVCGYCGSRNKAAHRYCVRCSAPLDAVAAGAPRTVPARARSGGLSRFLLAAAVIAALGVGFMVRTLFEATGEVAAVSEDVRADGAGTVTAPVAPPPAVSGWYPGANVPVEPDTAPTWPSGGTLPVARPNPYDVPGDPNSSMVGIAPSSSPRVRSATNGKRVFTEQDLLATRGSVWSTHSPSGADVVERESKLGVAESRVRAARARLQQARAQRTRSVGVDDDHLRKAIEQAADDLEDAEEDAAKAQRKLAEERRR
jgi:hypothetical protein